MTSIEWTRGDDGAEGKAWNPVRGCSRVSDGCTNCYAMRQAHRFSGPGKPYHGLTTIRRGKVDWSGRVRLVPEQLDAPLRWRKPRRVFVNSMSDLFHPALSNEEIAAVFGVMAAAHRHTFQVLTKRPDRMREWFDLIGDAGGSAAWAGVIAEAALALNGTRTELPLGTGQWPLPNVWLGVSAEDQQRADERIPDLLATPAAVRFVSAEPLLGPIDLRAIGHAGRGPNIDALTGWRTTYQSKARNPSECSIGVHMARELPALDWVIVGGESGHGARISNLADHRELIEQCRKAGVAVFHKQAGAIVVDTDYHGFDPLNLRDRKGGDPAEWPDDLRVREFPAVRS